MASAPAWSCPLVDGLVDFNCNQGHKIVFAGDSVVAGRGDHRDEASGGYPTRVARQFPQSTVVNLGVSGHTSRQVLQGFRRGKFTTRSRGADLLILDVGRNDCRDRWPTMQSVRMIKRTVKYVRNNIGESLSSPPLVAVATQIPNREWRRGCIEALNRTLLARKSKALPVTLRFDRLPASVLSADRLHPHAAGYDRIAKFANRFIRKRAQRLSLKERPDADNDGVYDLFELERYGTDPSLADSDGDGLLDGAEIFAYGTDPNSPDTDGGGVSDGEEVSRGTNPLDPSDD